MDWHDSYAGGVTPWDLRGITPPLLAFIERGGLAELGIVPPARVAVPGCGRGHDLKVLAAAGLRTTGFDVVPSVVVEARALLALNRVDGVEVLCRDVLGIAAEFAGAFDLVYDYTCFCALTPHLRAAYAREMFAVLRPGGVMLHLAFPLSGPFARPDRPPYLLRRADLSAAFGAEFECMGDWAALESVPERAGHEHWFAWRRPAATS